MKQYLHEAIRALDAASPLCFKIFRRPVMLDASLRSTALANNGRKRDRLWHNLNRHDAEKDMAHLEHEAAKYNIRYSFDGALTNTRDSLRLVLWAQTLGKNEELMAALGSRHFGEDAHMADHKVLLAAVREVGLDVEEATRVLASDDWADAVMAADLARTELPGSRRGFLGIPRLSLSCSHPLADWVDVIVGSQQPDVLLASFRNFERLVESVDLGTVVGLAPSSTSFRVCFSGRFVAVRDTPSLSGYMLGARKHGEIVSALAQCGSWIKLRGEAGWMAMQHSELGRLLENVSMHQTQQLNRESPAFVEQQQSRERALARRASDRAEVLRRASSGDLGPGMPRASSGDEQAGAEPRSELEHATGSPHSVEDRLESSGAVESERSSCAEDDDDFCMF